ncbi:MAG: hypothetical protein K1V99_02960 [Bacteroidales bacterium]
MENSANRIELGGFGTLLFVVFLVLKLCKVIDWSWWWVTAPLWGSVALFVVTLIICVVAAVFVERKW